MTWTVRLPWVAFWAAVVAIHWIDSRVFLAGYDSIFYYHHTEAEKRLQQVAIEAKERECAR